MSVLTVVHLSVDSRIREICELHWRTDETGKFVQSIANIANELKMKTSDFTDIVRKYSHATTPDAICDQCDTLLQFNYRSEFINYLRYSHRPWHCADCSEQAEAARQEIKRQAEVVRKENERRELERQRSLINWQFPLRRRLIQVETLSLENAVYLLSLIRVAAPEGLGQLTPLSETNVQLSPSADFSKEILNQLANEKLISAHPNSSVEAFRFEDGQIKTCYLLLASWAVGGSDNPVHLRDLTARLDRIFRTREWPKHWHNEALALWKKIAYQESLQFLVKRMNGLDLPLKIGDKTILTLEMALEECSVSQMYQVIAHSAGQALEYATMHKEIPRPRAANSVVGKIQAYVERQRSDSRPIKGWGRDWNLPQTMVSHVLSNTVLQIGDQGFTCVPSAALLNLPERDTSSDGTQVTEEKKVC